MAHWINLVSKDLFDQCGGENILRKEAPHTILKKIDNLYILQGSKMPPIGNINTGAKDIGELPGVARFLKPTRIQLTGLGDDKFDVKSWLGRFDNLDIQPWDNIAH